MASLTSNNMFSTLSESVPEKGLSKNARRRQNRKAAKQTAQEPVDMNVEPAIEIPPLSAPSSASSLANAAADKDTKHGSDNATLSSALSKAPKVLHLISTSSAAYAQKKQSSGVTIPAHLIPKVPTEPEISQKLVPVKASPTFQVAPSSIPRSLLTPRAAKDKMKPVLHPKSVSSSLFSKPSAPHWGSRKKLDKPNATAAQDGLNTPISKPAINSEGWTTVGLTKSEGPNKSSSVQPHLNFAGSNSFDALYESDAVVSTSAAIAQAGVKKKNKRNNKAQGPAVIMNSASDPSASSWSNSAIPSSAGLDAGPLPSTPSKSILGAFSSTKVAKTIRLTTKEEDGKAITSNGKTSQPTTSAKKHTAQTAPPSKIAKKPALSYSATLQAGGINKRSNSQLTSNKTATLPKSTTLGPLPGSSSPKTSPPVGHKTSREFIDVVDVDGWTMVPEDDKVGGKKAKSALSSASSIGFSPFGARKSNDLDPVSLSSKLLEFAGEGHTQTEAAPDSLAKSKVYQVVTADTPKLQSWAAVATSSSSPSSISSRKSSFTSSSSQEVSLISKAKNPTCKVKVSPQKVPVASDFPPVQSYSAPKTKESSSSATKKLSVLKLRL